MPAIRPQRGPQIKPKNLKAFSLRPSPDAYFCLADDNNLVKNPILGHNL